MIRSIWIAAGAAVLLAVGALTAVAANSHGNAVSTLATSTTLKGESKGDAISILARAKGDATSDAAKADSATRDTEADADAAAKDADDSSDAAATDKDAHGDAVSVVAKSEATAAQANGEKKVNHGGAVSAV